MDAEGADRGHRVADRKAHRDDRLRQLVGDDRRAGDDEQRDPLRQPAPTRPLGARDRLQGVRRGADANVDAPRRVGAGGLAQPCSWRRLSSRQSVAYGNGVEPLLRDRGAADGAGAVRARLDPRERLVDLGDHVVGVLAERLIELEVDEVRRVIGEVLVAGGGVDLAHALVVRREVAGCADDVLTEAEQLRPALARGRSS